MPIHSVGGLCSPHLVLFVIFLLLNVKSEMDAVSFAANYAIQSSCFCCDGTLLLLLILWLDDGSGSIIIIIIIIVIFITTIKESVPV